MIEYVTKSEMKGFAKQLDVQKRESLESRIAKTYRSDLTFLSHSSKDQDLVTGAIRVLTNHGASVYIDEIDPEMPPYTSAETAKTLKDRISSSRKFVLLATKNSQDSNWVPWELGIADGYKSIRNIALFPAIEDDGNSRWTNWEYMGLYHRIVWGEMKGREKPLWMVLDERSFTATSLSEWLRR